MNRFPVHSALKNLLESGQGQISIQHAGLLLDRYVSYPNNFHELSQKEGQQPHIDRICRLPSPPEAATILSRWDTFIGVLPVDNRKWEQTTIWRLAAHLSRASALENSSLCLHPIYGFPYLRGEGLKGLARAQAELSDAPKPQRDSIFGKVKTGAGNVVFHDAWPTHWPKLEKDIVNNHHRNYYEHQEAPGDWESPNPTYFMAVAAGTTFRFAVSNRDPDAVLADQGQAVKDLEQAQKWLQEGLRELGAGAKTAAGYGYFE